VVGEVSGDSEAGWRRHYRSGSAFGAEVSLIILHRDGAAARGACDVALAALRRVEEVLSLYRPQSELCRLNRLGRIERPHPDLVTVLRKGLRLSEQTGGAFDVTVQPLWELYASAKKEGRLPQAEELAAVRRRVDWRRLEVSAEKVRLNGEGMGVTLNALAQGFALDRVLEVLRAAGIQDGLVNTGEIGAMGFKEGRDSWVAGIQHPRQADAYVALTRLTDCCLSTSGDYATGFDDDRVRHHIFDPATGGSPGELASATVVAASGLDADGLSTAIMVLGAEGGLRLLRSYSGAEAFLVLKDGRTVMTPGFPKV